MAKLCNLALLHYIVLHYINREFSDAAFLDQAFAMSNYYDEDEEEAEEEEEMKVDVAEAGSEQSEKEDDYFTESSQTEIPYVIPAITTSQYRKYVQSIIKILVGETWLLDWMNRGQVTRSYISHELWFRVDFTVKVKSKVNQNNWRSVHSICGREPAIGGFSHYTGLGLDK